MPIRKELRHFYVTAEYKAARAACRDRAGDKCEACGAPNGDRYFRFDVWPYREVLVQCGASHVNNVAGDDRPENLRWLCRSCHLAADANFHKRTRSVRKDAARPLLEKLATTFGGAFEKLGRSE
jgi:hypothetical protein